MAVKATYQDVIKAIGKNYKEIESSIVNQLLLNVPNHYPTQGAYRENVWKLLFEMIIPKKYCIEQGVFIIDSYGNKSKEVDLVIFDELYTPYIFNYGEIKFIPIEAVSAVIECKSVELDNEKITKWAKSIDDLKTSMDSVARMTTMMVDNSSKDGYLTQTATRPIKILCSLAKNSEMIKFDTQFDILLSADEENKKLIKVMKEEAISLEEWNDKLNHFVGNLTQQEREDRRNKKAVIKNDRKNFLQDLIVEQVNAHGKNEENVIFTLIFQMNQLLMVINNPMLFPHKAYAECFTNILKEINQSLDN